MSKLYFRYGAMNSGKSTHLMQVAYNYEERGMKVILIKPFTDTKGGEKLVSRLGVERKVDFVIYEEDNILEKVKRYKLKEEDQWDLLKVPFDVANEELMEKFLEYVDEVFIAKLEEISKPVCFTGNLQDLEVYYQKINMYYSFSKIFNLKFDVEWVYNERLKVSEDINEILVSI